MFKIALFVIVSNWKQHNYSSTGDCINKLWYPYSAIKRNKLLQHTTWINLTISEQMKPDTKDIV